jgi:hypothetical protein
MTALGTTRRASPVDSGHLAMVTQADAVIDLIEQAAQGVADAA